MTPLDFQIFRGDSFSRTLTFTDPSGAGINVSAWTFSGQVRADPDNATVAASFTVDTTSAASGTITITLAASDTANFSTPVMVYDVQYTTGSLVQTFLAGRFLVTKDVTHP